MKKIHLLLFATILMLTVISGCKKDVAYGNVTFWFGSSNMAPATVTIYGQSNDITQFYTGGTPACNSAGCANFYLPAGTYSYTAQSSQYTWGMSGTTLTATVPANGCATILLQ